MGLDCTVLTPGLLQVMPKKCNSPGTSVLAVFFEHLTKNRKM
mgnify:CR=1 FL=1